MFCRLIVLLAFLCPTLAIGDTAPRRLTIDDVLAIQTFGAAAVDPTGRWAVYERTRPYEELGDYSYALFAQRVSGHQVWSMDLAEDGEPRLLRGLDPAPTSFIVGFSPSGRYLAVLQHSFGDFWMATCDMARGRCRRFAGTPDVRPHYGAPQLNQRVLWSSRETLVYPVLPDGVVSPDFRARAHIGRTRSQAWTKAWTGAGVTAAEAVSTRRDRTAEWDAGALVEINARTGDRRVLAEGRHFEARRSPDGRWLATGRASVRTQPIHPDGGVRDELAEFDRRYQFALIDIETGAARYFDAPFHIDPHAFAWSRDSQKVAVYGWQPGERPIEGRFHLFDIETGAIAPLDHASAGYALAPRAWWSSLIPVDGGPAHAALLDRGLAVMARKAEQPLQVRVDPSDGTHTVAPDAFGPVLLRADGTARPLARGLAIARGGLMHADARSVTYSTPDGLVRVFADGWQQRVTPPDAGAVRDLQRIAARRYLKSIRPDFSDIGAYAANDRAFIVDHATQAVRAVMPPSPTAVPLAVSPAGPAIYLQKDDLATRLVLQRPGRRDVTEIARIGDHLNATARAGQRTVTYTVTDPEGSAPPRQLQACLLLPPDFQDGRRYPLLFHIYPATGRSSCSDQPFPAWNSAHLFTARGFIHVRPAMPADLVRTPDGPIAGIDDIAAQTVDALVDQGLVDPDRVVLFGFSQGGVTSLYTASQTDRFKAVISTFGWADFFSHYFDGRGLYRYGDVSLGNRWRYDGTAGYRPFGFGVSPFDDPIIYAKNSPVALARGITAPVMLVHSDFDYFGVNQYDEMFNALYRLGKEARYVRYWGEGHGPSSPANIRDVWRRIDAFLAEHGVAPGPVE